ncbi:4-hydroxyphenylacetate 3-monooxygenase, oxygenase component [Aquibacillus sp. 3ASR75-11]|uniref:4-hydroxyphenylacetate 3-monooxygenase, oxygenase component n=1 Tax=Terrihalobacillus insolitus TaxID=2950438 RepID=A0A9X4ALW3_9BACI|nr:4-hydroxyphenylacetate 3-monooxygenase, oxygenase component [Terrihalobacillus insolitus]MDC3413567.1 4-hydroxyphenylacetate 3-monooxygenase, oxygenase component [Terrihalobacillus insolitus]MDC3424676.1 4-hydroxyphenylacetate 3-monooxygenase, oxygenase component [Terrihalobacillus insolitus]
MPAITGKNYMERVDQLDTTVWIDGSKLKGKKSESLAFGGVMKTQAHLYDLQYDKNLVELMTYTSPTTGNQIGTSFMQPRTKDDLLKRRKMIQEWAKASGGMMGRSPDYMNTILMALASSSPLLKGMEHVFPDNVVRFYEYAREKDLSFTHTFINPQVNRSQLYIEDPEEAISARIVDKTKDGLLIKGARLLATQGGITDEIIVLATGGVTNNSQAFAFSIPSDTTGLKFICRESFVHGQSSFNYPLSSRFEEMDSVVVFDHVLVPWDRVFYYENVDAARTFVNDSSFQPFALHQVVARQVVKTEFVLGVVQQLVDAIHISEYQHVQEKVAEVIVGLETMKALLVQSELDAEMDQWGCMRPSTVPLKVAITYFPKMYPRFGEIVQQLGASGFVSLPTENDFNSEIRTDLDRYLQSKAKNAEERVKLFRLAWDMTMSAFGTRQTLYERFFFGDPVRLTSDLYCTYNKEKYTKHIQDFLDKS